ncbi:CdaR family transcriptional regulator [Galactobacter sp.]|uniref:PucR family transcriptional regulator n=1 Tax=Galactobacter sp. TaxID=2676125 RepID=UPI0025C31AF6|nr:helix-turn-helix domain-containing protein [Galactobacter sp.]
MEMIPQGELALSTLLDSSIVDGVEPCHLSLEPKPVHHLSLVDTIDDISTVHANTLIVLQEDLSLGPWVVSAGLRMAWERRAVGLVVSRSLVTGAEIALAQRLDVSLLTFSSNPTKLVIDMSVVVGMSRAGDLARLDHFTRALEADVSLAAAVSRVSGELGGCRVSVESAQGVVLEAIRSSRDIPAPRRITQPCSSPSRDEVVLVADVDAHEAMTAERVLRAAAPTVRALVSESRMNALEASLPTLSFAALVGAGHDRSVDNVGLPNAPGESICAVTGPFAAVCVLAENPSLAGAALAQAWQQLFQYTPLAAIDDGWFVFIPAAGEDDLRRHARLMQEGLQGLALNVGLSGLYREPGQARLALREAWLAARLLAGPTPDISSSTDASPSVLFFREAPLQVLGNLFPRPLAAALGDSLLPNLVKDPASGEVIDATIAYLSAQGSVSAAAKLLSVHRNTVQARLKRAQELGVDLSQPERVLPLFMLLSALRPL